MLTLTKLLTGTEMSDQLTINGYAIVICNLPLSPTQPSTLSWTGKKVTASIMQTFFKMQLLTAGVRPAV